MATAKRSNAAPLRHRTPSLEVTDSVVKAALRIIGSDGPDSVTVRRLAAEAGVAPMSIYNHFGDMHGVFDAVFEHGFTEFAEALRVSTTSNHPVLAIQEMARAYRLFALQNPDTYAVMFLRVVPGFEASDESFVAAAHSFDELSSAVQRAIDTQHFLPADPALVAQEIWASCHGAVALELLGMCAFADPAETYNALLISLLRGLLLNPAESAVLA
jgi:AcrR family transcriptional regulator